MDADGPVNAWGVRRKFPAVGRTGAAAVHRRLSNSEGVFMKAYPVTGAIMFTSLALIISLISCSPKYVVRGRVVDGETRKPIEGAAVAIRWYSKKIDSSGTVDTVQKLSDDEGVFKIPEYPDKQHILAVYKAGYICWSSRDLFSISPETSVKRKYRDRKAHRIKDGMEIELRRLKNNHPKDLHAGFTVMVAGESTDSDAGPFNQAIQAEYQLWRENLRKDFQKQVGAK